MKLKYEYKRSGKSPYREIEKLFRRMGSRTDPLSLSRYTATLTYRTAQKVQQAVRDEYKKSTHQRAVGTRRAYRDPPPGPRTPKRKYRVGRPLKRSGTLQSAIVVKRLARGTLTGWEVTIDPDMTYAGKGDPWESIRSPQPKVADVAERLETGATYGVKVTRAMLAYLHNAVFPSKGKGSTGKVNKGSISLGDTLMITMPAKPTWKKVRARVNHILAREARGQIQQYIRGLKASTIFAT